MPGGAVNREIIEFAHRLADCAGAAILPHFRAAIQVTNKSADSFDPVTEADRGAEAAMRELIEKEFPEHGIVGEEFPDKARQGPFCWVLDPIDGTKSFIIGQPIWGTLIGLTYEGRPLFGMMDQSYLGERFWNADQVARFRNRDGEQPIRTCPCASLSEAILGSTSPSLFKREEGRLFENLSARCRMTRFGGDCYLYCMLAMGFIDIVAETGLNPFDIIPLLPIIEAAGGIVTTWDGGDPVNGGQILAVGDPSLHQAAMDALAP